MTVCAIQVLLDRTVVGRPAQREWRAQTQEQGAVRLPERRMIGVPADSPAESPVFPVAHLPVPDHGRGVLSGSPTAVFVPPRA